MNNFKENTYNNFYLNFPPINILDEGISKILNNVTEKLINTLKDNSIYRFMYFDYHSEYLDNIDKLDFKNKIKRKYIIEDKYDFYKNTEKKISASFKYSLENNISFTKLILKYKENLKITPKRFIIQICTKITDSQIKKNDFTKIDLISISKDFDEDNSNNDSDEDNRKKKSVAYNLNKFNATLKTSIENEEDIDIIKVTLNISKRNYDILKDIKSNKEIYDFVNKINTDFNGSDDYRELFDDDFKKSLLHHFIFIDKQNNHFYYIDSVPFESENRKNAYGGLFALSHNELDKYNLFSLIHISDLIGSQISSNTINHLFKISSVKSAIASIMSRNMSHNLGSHVLSAVSTGINDPTDIQYLTRYIQQRQDYIAQITTEFPKWSHSYRFIGQIMRYFFEQRLLLKYIAESEGLTAKEYYPENPENRIDDNNIGKLRFEINRITDENERIKEIPKEETDPDRGEYTLNDPLLAIPGGITGVQAFYSILENIIRNAAKHSYSLEKDINTEDGGLKVIIDYKIKETYVEFTIYTNVTKNDDEENNLKDKLNNKISASFIDDKNELKYENWGIAEIKISSGYLINASIELLGENSEKILYKKENKKDFGIIKAVEANSFKDSILIGYQFRINKPKEVLIISDTFEITDNQKNELNNNGIYIEPELPEVLDYNITVTNSKEYNKLPVRTIQLDNNVKKLIQNLLETIKLKQENKKSFIEDAENFIIELYNIWINTFDKEFELFIMPIDDKKDKAANVSLNGIDDYVSEKFGQQTEKITVNTFSRKTLDEINNKYNNKITREIYRGIHKVISDISKKYLKSETIITSKIFKKYNEYIETLPANYRFSNINDEYYDNNSDTTYENKETIFKEKISGIISDLKNSKIEHKNDIETTNEETVILHRHMSFGEYSDNALYREALSGAQSYFNEIKSIENNYSGKKLLLNIIETAYYQIHIIDERIAEYYYGFEEGSIIRKRIDNAGIKVYGMLNNKKIVKTTNNNLNNFMWKNENVTRLDNNILIIHQGIIDKFKKDFNIEIEEKNTPPVMFKGKYYVTSGRGRPEKEKMPKNAKYIPFSSISTSIIKQYPEKMLLIQSLLKISK